MNLRLINSQVEVGQNSLERKKCRYINIITKIKCDCNIRVTYSKGFKELPWTNVLYFVLKPFYLNLSTFKKDIAMIVTLSLTLYTERLQRSFIFKYLLFRLKAFLTKSSFCFKTNIDLQLSLVDLIKISL